MEWVLRQFHMNIQWELNVFLFLFLYGLCELIILFFHTAIKKLLNFFCLKIVFHIIIIVFCLRNMLLIKKKHSKTINNEMGVLPP